MHRNQNTKTKPYTGSSSQSTNPYRDLEERTTDFAKRVIRLCKVLPKDTVNRRLVDQIVRSSGSIGANYREANEALTKKDRLFRLRIVRKEAKETQHWLELIQEANQELGERMRDLFEEVIALRNIFSAIITKSQRE